MALLQELQRTNAGKKFNITTANPLLAGTYSDMRICTYKLLLIISQYVTAFILKPKSK